jgi:hypothetical protein
MPSFEYVIVAACVVATATAVLGSAGVGGVQGSLGAGLTAITNIIAAAV